MFNDKYGLTKAVLEGRKTQTRRILGHGNYTKRYIDKIAVLDAKYKVGEIVAVAQRYSDLGIEPFPFCEAGWRNKMFVKADHMPYRIQITNICIEHLQDISDEDCLAEGVMKIKSNKISKAFGISNSYEIPGQFQIFNSPREAYAALIDKVSGKGTWDSNPLVWVYEFELIK